MIIPGKSLAAPGGSLHGFMKSLAKGISRNAASVDSRKQARQAVHRIRTSAKRLRALLQIATPVLPKRKRRAARSAIRRVKAAVASARDADVMADLLKSISATAGEGDLATATRRPSRTRLMRLASDLEVRISALSVANLRLSEGLIRVCDTYSRARLEGAACGVQPLDDAMHNWRKRVKTLYYQAEAFSELTPLKTVSKRAKALAKLLGDHHDLAVLEGQLAKGKGVRPRLLPQIAARKATLTAQSLKAGTILFRMDPGGFAKLLQPPLRAALAKTAGKSTGRS